MGMHCVLRFLPPWRGKARMGGILPPADAFPLPFLPFLLSNTHMDDYLLPYARKLRANMTDAERKLWHELRRRSMFGVRFRRQVPLGRYIADFVCFEHSLVIEVDGSQHQAPDSGDEERDAWLNSQGYRVLRFTNVEVLMHRDIVLQTIAAQISPIPSPPAGEG